MNGSDALIEANRRVSFGSPEVAELGNGFSSACRRRDAGDPADGLQQVRALRHDLLDGLPERCEPYAASGPNWSNLRYMIVALEANPNAPAAQ